MQFKQEYFKSLDHVSSLFGLFQLAVENFGDQPAVEDDSTNFTYAELMDQVIRLSNFLLTKDVKRGDRVALVMDKSPFLIISILAVLKLGAIYVPIDPQSPGQTVDGIIDEVRPKLVILDIQHLHKINDNNVQLLFSDIDLSKVLNAPIFIDAEAEDDAYIIYTSGTTGKKKGVIIQNNSILNTLRWRIPFYQFGVGDAVLQIPSFGFDSSIVDIFSCLGSGSRLVLINDSKKTDVDYFVTRLIGFDISHFIITPSFYHQILPFLFADLKIKCVTLAGEATDLLLKNDHFNRLPNTRLINEYGPTENAVCSTFKELLKEDEIITIGKPIPSVKVRIMDDKMRDLGIGEKGEIFLGGRGLARGYYGQPELSFEKFITISGDVYYKTGDVGYFLEDGDLFYIGRNDRQIQLKGYRIELSSIEFELQQMKNIQQCSVIAQKNEIGIWTVVAFYKSEEFINADVLRKKLLNKMPHYMIPNHFVPINFFPLNQNGKLDEINLWKSYEVYNNAEFSTNKNINTPNSETEIILGEVITNILVIDKVEINTDLFYQGFDSLSSMLLVNMIYKRFGINILISELFNNPNIKELAKIIDSKKIAENKIKLTK